MVIENGKYKVQGLDLVEVAKEFGTPVYVYDAAKIEENYKKLRGAFSEMDVKIKYAAKALTNISVLKYIKSLGAGMDAVSLQEARIGLKAGFSPSDIFYSPNSVGFDEIEAAVELGLVVNIDNISILEHFGNRYHDSVPVSIRLNPHIMAGGNKKISTGHADSKFGISIYQLPHILKVVNTYNINVQGLHIHTGSDILDAEVFLKMAEILFGIAMDFRDLKFIDFGSGFKVAYKEGDYTTDIYDVGLKLGKAFKAFCKDYGRELEIWFEPGKYLVSESGYFLVQANVIKTTPATVFVGVNSGLNHLIRPMMYESYHEIINISNPNGLRRVYTVVGYICETDTFGLDRKLHEVREEDILVMKNAGAYSFMMSSNYNSRVKPPEVFIHNGEAHLIRKRETFEDVMRNQIELDF